MPADCSLSHGGLPLRDHSGSREGKRTCWKQPACSQVFGATQRRAACCAPVPGSQAPWKDVKHQSCKQWVCLVAQVFGQQAESGESGCPDRPDALPFPTYAACRFLDTTPDNAVRPQFVSLRATLLPDEPMQALGLCPRAARLSSLLAPGSCHRRTHV